MTKVSKKPSPNLEPLGPADIRQIREKLGLNQIEAGELLGGGIRAFQKYESGSVTPAATTVNLLRILDADPTTLGALTGSGVPIQQSGLRPFEVSGAHITALTDRYLVALTRRLLSAEAAKYQIPRDLIHVASNLTAPDGGEDARIIWEDGPERTPHLPTRNCLIQIKAANVTASRAAKDVLTAAGDLEAAIRETLESGGTYMMLCNRPFARKSIIEREAALREVIHREGITIKANQVAFRDADQVASWVNDHPQVAIWVLEQTQPGLATTLRTWTHWAGRHEHQLPYVQDQRLPELKRRLREAVTNEREAVRVVGLSGLGKSRLVLEALIEEDEGDLIRIDDLVLYAAETEIGATAIKGAVQLLADLEQRAIIVIDRCAEETHVDLASIIRRSGSRLSLITIDHEIPSGSLPRSTILVNRADDKVIEAVIDNLTPGLPSEDKRRLITFANGFPQLAVLSAEAWVANEPLATVTKDYLIEQVVVGRQPANRQETISSASILSVFGLLGLYDEVEAELTDVATYVPHLTANQLRSSLIDLVRRRIVQPRGRLVTIQPRPIALRLAERQWSEWARDIWDAVLTKAPKVLRERAAKQLAQLNQTEIAIKVAQHLCRRGGPLDTFEAIQDDANASVIDYLSQIDAIAVAELLGRVFDGLEPGKLLELEGEARGEIVWAVQKIAFVPEAFEAGARLLLQLALAENQEWSNNSVGQFKALFPAYLGDTAADGEVRLRFLDDLIHEAVPQYDMLLVDALEAGSQVTHFSRSVGIEVHGLRPALKPWEPDHDGAVSYISKCLDRLLTFALRDDPAGDRARQALSGQFRVLIGAGFLPFVEAAVAQITQSRGSYWPTAHSSIGDVIAYDLNGAPSALKDQVRALLAMITPSELATRIRMLVTEMPWDYPCDEKLEFADRERRQRHDVHALADEALANAGILSQALPNLMVGSQRMTSLFGAALVDKTSDPVALLWQLLHFYRDAPVDQRNPDLLTSYLAQLATTKPRLVETFKRRAIQSPSVAALVPLLAWKMGLSSADILMVCEALRDGRIKVDALSSWSYGGRITQLTPADVAPLFDQLFSDGEAAGFGYDLLGMYAYGNGERLEHLRPQIRLAADKALSSPSSTMNDHHFHEMVTWILSKGNGDPDARAVALSLTRQIIAKADRDGLSAERRIKPLLPVLLRHFPEISWPLIAQAVVAKPRTAWRFQHLLGRGFSFGDREGACPILELSVDVLLEWGHAHPEVAPAFLAGVLPILTSRKPDDPNRTFHPVTRRLIDEFGERPDVQSALGSNMQTFSWSGSRSTYYELYKEPLAALHDHSKPSVRRWARKMSDAIAKQVEHEQNSDDEESAGYE